MNTETKRNEDYENESISGISNYEDFMKTKQSMSNIMHRIENQVHRASRYILGNKLLLLERVTSDFKILTQTQTINELLKKTIDMISNVCD